MKSKLIFIAFYLINFAIFSQAKYENLIVTPAIIEDGDTITMTYRDWGKFTESKIVYAYIYVNEGLETSKVYTEKLNQLKKGQWEGSFTLPPNAVSFLVSFRNLNMRDNNNGIGYWFTVSKNNKTKPDALASIADMYAGWRSGILGLDARYDIAKSLYEQEFTVYPYLKRKHFFYYLIALKNLDNKTVYENEFNEFRQLNDLKEYELMYIVRWLKEANQTAFEQLYKKLWADKYPQSGNVVSEISRQTVFEFYQPIKFSEKKELYASFIKSYEHLSDSSGLARFYGIRSNMLASMAKYYLQNKEEQSWHIELNQIPSNYRTGIYWLSASDLLDKKTFLDTAEIFAKYAVQFGRKDLELPRNHREPLDMTDEEIYEFRATYYSYLLATYGEILLANHKIYEAKNILHQASVEYGFRKRPEHNKIYIETLLKLNLSDSAKIEIEKVQEIGQSDPSIDSHFRINNKKNNNNSNVQKANVNQKVTSLLKESLPFFYFTNIEGDTVSHDSFKGKIVVLDFWATWCGSCIEGFKGMYNLTKKYESDKSILFLFINVNEFGANKEQKAKQLLKDKKYDFNLLFDLDNHTSTILKVKGLPTKLIIDKDGFLRFRQEGHNGKTDSERINEVIQTLLE